MIMRAISVAPDPVFVSASCRCVRGLRRASRLVTSGAAGIEVALVVVRSEAIQVVLACLDGALSMERISIGRRLY